MSISLIAEIGLAYFTVGFMYWMATFDVSDLADIVLWPLLLLRGLYRRTSAIIRGDK